MGGKHKTKMFPASQKVARDIERAKYRKGLHDYIKSTEGKKLIQDEIETPCIRQGAMLAELITIAYLENNFRCQKNGIMKFIEFARQELLVALDDDDDYIGGMIKHLMYDYGIDIQKELGTKLRSQDYIDNRCI